MNKTYAGILAAVLIWTKNLDALLNGVKQIESSSMSIYKLYYAFHNSVDSTSFYQLRHSKTHL